MSGPHKELGERFRSSRRLAEEIIQGGFDHDLMAFRIGELADRGETTEDILAMATAFKEAAIPVPTALPVVADLCGTGGARFRTFNVSTTASFVLAASGVPVAKHGNRSQNGRCGSADVIETLGGRILATPEEAGAMLDRLGFSFLFAPSFHPAMKNAVPVRRQLKRRTIFNMIGPLLNPVVCPRRHLMGVYDPRLLDILPQVLDRMGILRAMIVHGYPGMDEVSTLGPNEVVEVRNGSFVRFQIDPREYGIPIPDPKSLSELAPCEAAEIVRGILGGIEGAQRDLVVLNAACAMLAFGRVTEVEKGLGLAERAIDSGAALRKLDQFLSTSKDVRESPTS